MGAAAGIGVGLGAAGLLGGSQLLMDDKSSAPSATSGDTMQVSTISLGKVTVTRVVEYRGPVGLTSRQLFPESSEELWQESSSWLSPDFWNPDTDIVPIALQT
jgi:hypothetical protein